MDRDELANLRAELVADLEARQRREAADPFYDPPPATPLVRKSARNGGLLYSVHENEPAPAPMVASEPVAGEHVVLFGDERDEILTEGIGQVISGLRREFKRQLAQRDKEIEALRAQIDALSTRGTRKSRA
jgi:hypothetical protein